MSNETVATEVAETKAIAKVEDKPKKSIAQTVRQTDELSIADAAKIMMTSGLVKSNEDAGKILTKLNFGRGLGLNDVASINGIGLTPNGTLILSAALMLSLIKRSGRYKIKYKQRTDKICEIEVFEKFEGEWESCGTTCSFSWDDAVRAGLTSRQTYKQFPKQMLTARCIADVFRTHCADCTGVAVYTPEEIPDSNFKTDPDTLEMVPDAEFTTKSKGKKAKAAEDDTLGRIRELLKTTASDEEKLCAHFGVKALDGLSLEQQLDLESLLKKKAKAKV